MGGKGWAGERWGEPGRGPAVRCVLEEGFLSPSERRQENQAHKGGEATGVTQKSGRL